MIQSIRSRILRLGLALAFALPAALMALPAATPASAQTQGVALTNELIDSLLASFGDMRALGRKYDKSGKAFSGDPGAMSGIGAYLQGHAAMGAANAILSRNGFDGMAGWIDAMTTLSITLAMAEQDRDPRQMKAEMEKAIAQIEATPMPQDQKDAMRNALLGSAGIMGRVTPENYALVYPRRAEIRAAMDKAQDN